MPSDRCVRIPGEAWWASRRRWRGRVLPDEENFPRKCVVQAVRSLSSASITLAVCGDPIICRALVLLLQDFSYYVKFLPASYFGEPGSLEDVQILLLTPERNTERREATLASLERRADMAAIPTLELVAAFEGRRERRRKPAWLQRKVPWPCSTDELKRYIEAALSDDSENGSNRSPHG